MKTYALHLVLLAGVGCVTESTKSEPADCDTVDLGAQSTQRLPTGHVLWLPSSNGPECSELKWSMVDAPDAFITSDGRGFISLRPGTFTLEESSTGTTIDVTAIASASVPFHNLMYLPNRSMVQVDDELWVAEGIAPRVARLDAETGELTGTIEVGPWPTSIASAPSTGLVVVTQAADDTVSLIDTDTMSMVDRIWVGDEPAVAVVHDDSSMAYVTLETEDAVAVVDLDQRSVVGRLPAPRGPRALDITDDGSVVFVAGHRTGQPDRYPYASAEWDSTDLMAVDASTGAVVWTVQEAGNIISDVVYDASTSTVWVATTVAFPERGLVDLERPPFEAQLHAYDAETGDFLQATVLAPAAEGAGYVLGPQGITVNGESVWVVAQDSELAVELDKRSLQEIQRIPVPGGPRSVLGSDDGVWVHASLGLEVHRIVDGQVMTSTSTGSDPRPADLAAGQLYYIQPGESYGQNFSCNSCHYDGRGDTQVWRAGPFETWELSRPMMWLEGTAPLGWGAYVNDTETFGYTGFASIIARWPTTDMADDLGAFLRSLAPPPKANGLTARDGGLSDDALIGKALFEGRAGCVGCHSGPLTTTNQTFEDGITEGRVSTPVLVGAYRHSAWLKDGSAHTLADATMAAAQWSGISDLSEDDVTALVRYLRELTDRDFFLLSHEPEAGRTFIAADEPVTLIFNQPVWTGSENLARVKLIDAGGAVVATTVTVETRRITITPDDPLAPDAVYTAVVEAGLESFDERKLPVEARVDFFTAAAPEVAFDGEYSFTVDLPAFDFEADGINPDVTIAMVNAFSAEPSASGSSIRLQLNDGLEWSTEAIIDGVDFEIPAIPIKAGNALAQASSVIGTGEDTDGDGVIDWATGTFVVSGPGFHIEDVVWTIEPAASVGGCVEGAAGAAEVDVSVTEDGVVIDWGEQRALGLYVTTYGADLPLGPGMVVSNGDAYWAISTTDFPTGFAGPVTYGTLPDAAVDDSVANGAPLGGATLEEGQCYQFSVITSAFQIGSYTLIF